MGNVNVNKNYNKQERYVSQYSLSDLISSSCVNSVRSPHRDHRGWPHASQRSCREGTSKNTFGSSKTLWPVSRTQAIFLPEFEIREGSNDSYIILDIIATGAYGTVYKASRRDTKEVFALKAINKARVVAENAVEQAKQEVAIQRVVGHHPFLLNSPDRWQSRRTLYILTDYVGGGELFSLVERLGSLPELVVRIYVGEIALAIDFLHNAGVVHRDLKATNVLLDKDGHAVLIDFGLATWLKREERTMTICGTPEYMAPEILKKEEYGQEVDWWSLGVLTHFLLLNQVCCFNSM
ncbi:hypothetical protein KM043_004775 [Ampulex compressa]|nr:hypothetical protein KM043_004775 [Ampulex compressa]